MDNASTAISTANATPGQAVIGDIEQFLQAAIQRLEPEWAERRRAGPGRPRVLPSLCLWAGLLVCLVRGFTSQTALWRWLTDTGLWSYPRFALSDQAIFKRLATGGTHFLETLFTQIRDLLQDRLAPYAATTLAPFASAVLALDATTLDPLARRLPRLRPWPAGASELLPGKLAGLFEVRRQQWLQVQYVPEPYQNDKVAAWDLVAATPEHSLLLADLGYFGFAWFDHLTDLKRWWISRLRAKTSYQLLHTYYQAEGVLDCLIWLGAYRADRAAHAVRLVQFPVGAQVYRYLTNVLDPAQLPLGEIARLYARRWDFEMAVNLVKTHLHLHLLWSSKPPVVLQQVWGVLILSQILHALQLEIAGRAGVDPCDVALALWVEYAPRLAAEGRDPVSVFVERGRALGFIRPSRRIKIQVPIIPPHALTPLPPDLQLVRTPRYAERKGTHRKN